jgi:tetratricopeptide (TPR) repeat protein
MSRFLKWGAVALIIFGGFNLNAQTLPVPSGLGHFIENGELVFRWNKVDQAAMYRLAVFGPQEEDGQRPLMVAVWIKEPVYKYGQEKLIAVAGKLPSTQAKELESGVSYRWMVSAARLDGRDRSNWSGGSFILGPVTKATPAIEPVLESPAEPVNAEKKAELVVITSTAVATTFTAAVEESSDFEETPQKDLLVIDFGSDEAESLTKTETPLATARPAEKNDLKSQEQKYRIFIREEPDNADYWEALGDILVKQSMFLEAKEAYEQALKLDKSKKKVREWLLRNTRSR